MSPDQKWSKVLLQLLLNQRRPGFMFLLFLILLFFWIIEPSYHVDVNAQIPYLSLHSILETFSIAVSIMIFGIIWHSYNRERAGNSILLACAFLMVGLIDLAHMIFYPGMPGLGISSNEETGIYYWLIARFLGSIALLLAAILPWRPFRSRYTRYVFLFGSLILVACVYWSGLFYENFFPKTFVPGAGLTPFKMGTEYLISAIHAVTALILASRFGNDRPFDISHLLTSVIVMGMSEIWFTIYNSATDIYNLMGHVYKIIAYYFLYRAVFVDSVQEPFRRLYQSEYLLRKNEEWLSTTLRSIGDAVIATDSQERVVFLNPVAEHLTGWTMKDAEGQKLNDIFRIVNETTREKVESPVEKVLREGKIVGLANHTVLISKDGTEFPIDDSAAPICDIQGNIMGVVLVFRDISERKRMEKRLRVKKEQLESFVKHTADVIAIFDLEGRALELNNAYETIFGWTVQEVLGGMLPSIPEHLIGEAKSIFKEVRHGKNIIGFETIRQHKDGQFINVSVTYSPVWDAQGNIVAVSGILRDITESKQKEQEQKRLVAILEATTDFVSISDRHGRVLYYNQAARKILGIDDHEDISKIHIPDTHPEWAGKLVITEGLPTALKEGKWSGETAFLSRNGTETPAHQIILSHKSSDGKAEYYSTIARDLTDIKKSEERERLAAQVLENISEGVLITDRKGIVVSVNPAYTQITGHTEEDLIGKHVRILSSGIDDGDFYKFLRKKLIETEQWEGEVWDHRKNGESYFKQIAVSPVKDKRGKRTHYVAVTKDITPRKRMEEKIQYQAYHDILTDLPNRILFLIRLTQAIKHAKKYQLMAAVMFLDLDRFKLINDTLGHSTGDLLLQSVAARLLDSVGSDDTVSRLGGDEFLILLPRLANASEAVNAAESILEALSHPFVLNRQEYFISASIGISFYPIDGDDEETLIKNADTAMYLAKKEGNCYHMFTSALNAKTSKRLRLETDLRKALEREEFILHYQPKVDLRTGKITGMEALVRWQHPEFGMIPPNEFIPLSEETGLIIPLGEWVLRTACRQNKAWQEEGFPPVRIAVNLSFRQFQQKNLTETLAQILKEIGLAPYYLELELTESIIMNNPDTTIRILQEVKDMGIWISLDDFGTGYSSLNYLKRLPLDTLKIDRTFVQQLGTHRDKAIVRALIDLAHHLDIKVITEGVETEDQLKLLRSFQCDEMQGYIFSPPVSAETFRQMLQKHFEQ
ncbi:PAS domain S-box protein [Ferviditalea candida]|uniref:PAS domain S-box protein n=1 Tax=Ferviditalea candida TaxID=3108399 RepID=A0ABU5ZE80_9BACL|nr:PAS domain S-box protein [Paenibacillaceae bacterium T2]